MLKGMLEDAIGKKVDIETFKVIADMTTKDIKFHNINLVPKMTKMDYVMTKLIESVQAAERAKEGTYGI